MEVDKGGEETSLGRGGTSDRDRRKAGPLDTKDLGYIKVSLETMSIRVTPTFIVNTSQLDCIMVVLRNRISAARSGGPRQFTELRDRFLVKVSEEVDGELSQQLTNLGLETRMLSVAPVLVVTPSTDIADVLDRVRNLGEDDTKIRQAIDEVRGEDGFIEATASTIEATNRVIRQIEDIDGVEIASFMSTKADFGPENLRLSPTEMPTIPSSESGELEGNLQQLVRRLNIPDAWEVTRGENAIVAIFDTGFAKGLIDENRIKATFHGDSVNSVYASAEGHGTMCAGAAAASKSKQGVPMDGAAPEADVILVRITDDEGQINTEIVADAWDWLDRLSVEKPIVTNHSYGTPLCSGRPRTSFCNDPLVDVIDAVNSSADVTSCYAAGNEAMYCGHRPSGITNGITGHNSLASVITVGALLTDGREAQRYSSHGRGDCAPVADPKPNLSCAIPRLTYYGVEDGWEVKDMSTGLLGSSGGTSHASPMTCGMLALLQSAAVENRGEPLQTEEVKQIIEDNSKPPRRTQINSFGFLVGEKGHDARFGFGQLQIDKAIQEVQ